MAFRASIKNIDDACDMNESALVRLKPYLPPRLLGTAVRIWG
jgi:hypothetical protein